MVNPGFTEVENSKEVNSGAEKRINKEIDVRWDIGMVKKKRRIVGGLSGEKQ